MVSIESKTYDDAAGGWATICTVELPGGHTVRGPQFVTAPEDATDADLAAAILALYGV